MQLSLRDLYKISINLTNQNFIQISKRYILSRLYNGTKNTFTTTMNKNRILTPSITSHQIIKRGQATFGGYYSRPCKNDPILQISGS